MSTYSLQDLLSFFRAGAISRVLHQNWIIPNDSVDIIAYAEEAIRRKEARRRHREIGAWLCAILTTLAFVFEVQKGHLGGEFFGISALCALLYATLLLFPGRREKYVQIMPQQFLDDLERFCTLTDTKPAENAQMNVTELRRRATASLVSSALQVINVDALEEGTPSLSSTSKRRSFLGVVDAQYELFLRFGLVAKGGYKPFFEEARVEYEKRKKARDVRVNPQGSDREQIC